MYECPARMYRLRLRVGRMPSEGDDAEIEVGLRAGDDGAEVGVRCTNSHVCRIFTIYRDDGRPILFCV